MAAYARMQRDLARLDAPVDAQGRRELPTKAGAASAGHTYVKPDGDAAGRYNRGAGTTIAPTMTHVALVHE